MKHSFAQTQIIKKCSICYVFQLCFIVLIICTFVITSSKLLQFHYKNKEL